MRSTFTAIPVQRSKRYDPASGLELIDPQEASMAIPTAPIVATGLVGGFAAARYSGHRDLGGALFAAAGAWCVWTWQQRSGPGVMGVLGGVYAAAFGVSHPLAKKIGAWPSVLAVSAVAAGTTYLAADRRRGVVTQIGLPRD